MKMNQEVDLLLKSLLSIDMIGNSLIIKPNTFSTLEILQSKIFQRDKILPSLNLRGCLH